jgi:hypothetical protein
MSISEETKKELFLRAGGQCECTMQCSHHTGKRCPQDLRGGWEAHRRTAGGTYELGNLIAMCVTCHKNTRTYGRG